MARIRTIKPSFWGSGTTAALSRDARLVAIGLVSCADDDGRFLGAVAAINGYIFPNDEVPPTKLRKWVDEVADTGLIHLYQHEGIRYGCFPKWHQHQVINRYTPSILPEPDCDYVRRGSKGAA